MNMIRPDLLAGKLETETDLFAYVKPGESAAKFKELLWFLQAVSMRPRGLDNLSDELLAQSPEKFISKAMAGAGHPAHGKNYDLSQCLEIWKSYVDRFCPFGRKKAEINPCKREQASFSDWIAENIDLAITPDALEGSTSYDKAEIVKGCKRFNYDFLHGECLQAAQFGLQDWLIQLCTRKNQLFSSPWYCANLTDLLLDYMERHADQERAAIAETEVTKIVFRNLEFARSQNVPVPIVGESRIGKTSPAAAWCAMRPGRARLVTVPESNRFRDFIEAHADAFGIEYSPSTSTAALTALVKYVHRHSGLFICYDESQFLIPVNYHKATPPARLNFVRCQVIDRDLGCAFFATPQSYKQSLDQFAKTTGYRMEQWLGRLAPVVVLPADLGGADLLAVAKLHFTDLPEPYLKLIAASAMKSEGYLKNMEITAKWARFIASERGHARPDLADVKAAIAQMTPETPVARPAISKPAVDNPAPGADRMKSATPKLEPDRFADHADTRAENRRVELVQA